MEPSKEGIKSPRPNDADAFARLGIQGQDWVSLIEVKLLIQQYAIDFAALQQQLREKDAEIAQARLALWQACPHQGKYGDDGEMQCHALDFKRGSIERLAAHTQIALSEQLTASQREVERVKSIHEQDISMQEKMRSDLQAENATLKDDNEKMRSIITTPEVYVGVVTDACEKHWAELIVHEKNQRKALQAELDAAVGLLERLSSNEDLREGCHATYNGGHHDEACRKAFHHGMDTVCNVIQNRMDANAAFLASRKEAK